MGARETEAFIRLYMVPGMQHCGGGPGTDYFGQGAAGVRDAQHNMELAVEEWVEKGSAPPRSLRRSMKAATLQRE